MSNCECYKIGGPWITFDPDCSEHGYEAQERDKERASLEARVARLEEQVRRLTGHEV